MPYEVRELNNEYCVYQVGDDNPLGCHVTSDLAYAQITSIELSEGKASDPLDLHADDIKLLNERKRKLWLDAYNEAYTATQDDTKAVTRAWGAVRRDTVNTTLGIKSFNAEGAIVEGWGTLFTDGSNATTERDLVDEYFHEDDTDAFLLEYYQNAPLYYEHGMSKVYGITPIGNRVSAEVKAPIGIWVAHQLHNDHPKYNQTVNEVERGELSYSVDGIESYTEDDGDGRLQWSAPAWSLTKTPAEPGLGMVKLRQIKSLITRTETEAQSARGGGNTLNNLTGELSKMDNENEDVIAKMDDIPEDDEAKAEPEAKADDGEGKNVDELTALFEAILAGYEAGDLTNALERAGELTSMLEEYEAMAGDEMETPMSEEMRSVKALSENVQALMEKLDTTPKNSPPPKAVSRSKSATYERFNINKENHIEGGLIDLIQAQAGIPPLRFRKSRNPIQDAIKSTSRRLPVKADLSGQSGIGGGYWVNSVISNEVIKPLYTDTVMMRAGATRRNLPSGVRSQEIRRWDNTTVARFGGEGDTTTESRPDTDYVTLEQKKVVVEVILTEEELEFADASVEAQVREDMQMQAMILIDNSSLRGDGTKRSGDKAAQFVGLRYNTNASELTSIGTAFPTYPDLNAMIKAINKRNVEVNEKWAWVWNYDINDQVANMPDTTGRPLLSAFGDTALNRFRGITVHPTNQIPSNLGAGSNETEIYCGDFSKVIMSFSNDLRVVTDTSVLIRNGEVLIRGTFYAGTTVTRPEAFQIITDAKAV